LSPLEKEMPRIIRLQVSVLPMCMTSVSEFAMHLYIKAASNVLIIIVTISLKAQITTNQLPRGGTVHIAWCVIIALFYPACIVYCFVYINLYCLVSTTFSNRLTCNN